MFFLKRVIRFIKMRQLLRFADISIGVVIRSELCLGGGNTIGEYTILEGGQIKLGKHATISSHCVLRGPITIGNFSQIGPHVGVYTRAHPLKSISINVSRRFLNGARKKLQQPLEQPVSIGSDVWVGASAVILPGVKIGDGAIVAAGSVVREDVPPFTMVAGVPARMIGRRFNSQIEELVASTAWWSSDLQADQGNSWIFFEDDLDLSDFDALRDTLVNDTHR